MDLDKEIGINIKRIRVQRNVTQESLGMVLGVSSQQISKYESGVNQISASNLYVIAAALGTKIEDMFWIRNEAMSSITETIGAMAVSSAPHLPSGTFEWLTAGRVDPGSRVVVLCPTVAHCRAVASYGADVLAVHRDPDTAAPKPTNHDKHTAA